MNYATRSPYSLKGFSNHFRNIIKWKYSAFQPTEEHCGTRGTLTFHYEVKLHVQQWNISRVIYNIASGRCTIATQYRFISVSLSALTIRNEDPRERCHMWANRQNKRLGVWHIGIQTWEKAQCRLFQYYVTKWASDLYLYENYKGTLGTPQMHMQMRMDICGTQIVAFVAYCDWQRMLDFIGIFRA